MNDQREDSHTEGPARDIWAEMCEAEAAQKGDELMLEESTSTGQEGRLESVSSCSEEQTAKLRAQEGQGTTQHVININAESGVMAVDDSDEDEVDTNLEDLLELQAMGVKVILPTRKRKIKEVANTREGGDAKTSRKESSAGKASGTSAAQGDPLSVAEGEQP